MLLGWSGGGDWLWASVLGMVYVVVVCACLVKDDVLVFTALQRVGLYM